MRQRRARKRIAFLVIFRRMNGFAKIFIYVRKLLCARRNQILLFQVVFFVANVFAAGRNSIVIVHFKVMILLNIVETFKLFKSYIVMIILRYHRNLLQSFRLQTPPQRSRVHHQQVDLQLSAELTELLSAELPELLLAELEAVGASIGLRFDETESK